jgi:hypothetical protein
MFFSYENKIIFYVLVVSCCGWLSGCRQVKPAPPARATSQEDLPLPVSNVVFPIEYDFAKIEELVNQKLSGTFVRQTVALDSRGDSLRLEISRTEKIRLWWRDKKVHGRFPLRVEGWATVKKLGITLKNAKPVSTDIVVHIESFTRIGRDWNLEFNTEITKLEWRSDPKLHVGPLRINLRKPIQKVVEERKGELATKLDHELVKIIPLKSVVGDIWQKMQRPILINRKKLAVYLLFQPKDITAKILSTKKTNVLEVRIATRGLLTTSFSDSVAFRPMALPVKKDTEATRDSLHLFVLAKIPFRNINAVLGPEVAKKPLRYEGYEARIKSAEVFGATQNRLAVGVDIRGDIKGKVYMTGVIAYDTGRQQLRVRDFGFDVDSEAILVKSADWLLHDYATELFSDKLQVDLAPVWERLPTLIAGGIEKGRSGEKINLLIDSLTVRPPAFLINQREVQVLFEVHGGAHLQLEDAIFSAKKRRKGTKKI